ncbi:Auxin efflux carrier component 4 [Abeliophyllum distichum]|uniref:Auxin efflux carrier component 4 n=1 Tax=Abeliophyllum distichum TaxID=126358 RepID=A0ABD1UIG8_9LAMI
MEPDLDSSQYPPLIPASKNQFFLKKEHLYSANDVYGVATSRRPTPRPSNFEEKTGNNVNKSRFYHGNAQYPGPNPGIFSPNNGSKSVGANAGKKPNGQQEGVKDLHMFVWSSSASPVSDVFGGHDYGALDQNTNAKEVRVSPGKDLANQRGESEDSRHNGFFEVS